MPLNCPNFWAHCSCMILLRRCMQGLLVQLKQDDDEMSQLDALGQLNELLSISNEESLSMFPLDQLIPTLVGGLPRPDMLRPHPSPLPHTDAHWLQVMP